MNDHCPLIRDLLALYAEGMTSPETNRFIESHLEGCDGCRQALAALRAPQPMPEPEDIAPLKKLRHRLTHQRNLVIAVTALVVAAVFVLVAAFLTTPEYLPAGESVVSCISTEDKTTIIFSDKVAGYQLDGPYGEEGEIEYCLSAWTTLWAQLTQTTIRNPRISIPLGEDGSRPTVYYSANDGSEMSLLTGLDLHPYMHGIVLPRLVLNHYALIALFLLLVAAALYFPLRRRRRRLWERLLLAPASYLIAHIIIRGFSPETYAAARDFCLILLLAMALYGALVLGLALIRRRKADLPQLQK